MLQVSSEEEEEEAERVDVDDLRAMMTQARSAQADPYNKMHGRAPNPWVDDEEDKSHLVQRAINVDQAPLRRRKKKTGLRQDDRSDLEKAESLFQRWFPGRRVTADADTQDPISRSSSMSMPPMPQSGSAASSSGISSMTLPRERQSGSAAPARLKRETQSGSSIPNPSGKKMSGTDAAAVQSEPGPSAGSASSSTSLRVTSQSGLADENESGRSVSRNPWNEFQKAYKGRNWGTEKMRAEFWKMRATGKWPA